MPNESPAASMAPFYEGYWAHRVERGDTTADNRVKLRHEQAAAWFAARLTGSPAARVLDLGCGDGLLGQVIAGHGHGHRLTGADVAPRALDLCRPYYDATGVFDLDADETPEDWREAFDAVACLEVLEHLRRPERAMRCVREALRPGGVVALSYPNLFSWKNRLVFVRGRWPSGYTTYDPVEHLQVFDLPGFKKMVRDAGLELTGLQITPDLPAFKPLRRAVFRSRGLWARLCPALVAMQINVYARRP